MTGAIFFAASLAVVLACVAMLVFSNGYQLLAGAATLVISFLLWHMLFKEMGNDMDKRAALRAKAKTDWITKAQASDCKSTGFVATKNEVHTVWTCPDGTAHLQP